MSNLILFTQAEDELVRESDEVVRAPCGGDDCPLGVLLCMRAKRFPLLYMWIPIKCLASMHSRECYEQVAGVLLVSLLVAFLL